MARPLRIAFPGALNHITSRGNNRRGIFFDEDNRYHFLRFLTIAVERFAWTCFAYCLMDNHYHLLIETAMANISRGMQYLNGAYTQYVNWTRGRVGHLFQGRFHTEIIEKETYFLEVCRYLPLNPVRAKMCSDPGDYRWSSFQATAGTVARPPFLTVQPILERFGPNPSVAQALYRRFVIDGIDERPFEHVRERILLGSDSFVEQFKDKIYPRQLALHRVENPLPVPTKSPILRI